MCFHKYKPQPITGNKVALLFGINDYMGSQNDLAGCINDINDVELKLKKEFSDFQIRKFEDSAVTTHNFLAEIKNAYNTMRLPGILYIHYSGHGTQIPNIQEVNKYDEALMLYNGPLVDDNIWQLQQETPEGLTVVAKFDSCFSGGMYRGISKIKNRFMALPGIRVMRDAARKFNKTESDQWVIFSGCGEGQTSADAWFNNRPNGAFTYYDLQSFGRYHSAMDEFNSLRNYLPNSNFDQTPSLRAPERLLNKLVLSINDNV